MSAVIRSRRAKSKPVSTTALWLVLGLAVTFFLVRFGQEFLLEQDLKARAAAQRAANAALRDENSRLEASLGYFSSDKYVEQRAREDLNLRRPDERVLIPIIAPPQAGAGEAQQPLSAGDSPPSSAPDKANWQKWLDLFAPPGSP